MIDVEQLIFEHATANVAANSVLYGLIGTNAWSPVAEEGWQNDSAAIVFNVPVESKHFTAPTVRALFDVKLYGGTQYFNDARAVYRAFVDRFHGHVGDTTATGIVLMCELITGTKNLVEPVTKYPYCFAKFELHAQ